MKDLYKQCVLQSGDSVIVSWLLASEAKVGIRVTLKDSDDPTKWWTITSVGKQELAKKDIKDSHEAKNWYKKDFRGKLKGLNVS